MPAIMGCSCSSAHFGWVSMSFWFLWMLPRSFDTKISIRSIHATHNYCGHMLPAVNNSFGQNSSASNDTRSVHATACPKQHALLPFSQLPSQSIIAAHLIEASYLYTLKLRSSKLTISYNFHQRLHKPKHTPKLPECASFPSSPFP